MIYAANKDCMTWYYLEYGHHVARLRHWAYQQSLPQANVACMSISMHERGFLPSYGALGCQHFAFSETLHNEFAYFPMKILILGN